MAYVALILVPAAIGTGLGLTTGVLIERYFDKRD